MVHDNLGDDVLPSDNRADWESDDIMYGGEGVDWIYTGAYRTVIETLNGFDMIGEFDVEAGDRLVIGSAVNGLRLTSAADVIALARDNPDGDMELGLGG